MGMSEFTFLPGSPAGRRKRWNPPMITKKPCVVVHPGCHDLASGYFFTCLLSDIPSLSFAISPAIRRCRIAHDKIYSGTSSAHMNSGSRCEMNERSGSHSHRSKRPISFLLPGYGTLGWMATQVHKNIVTRQLQIIFQTVRHVCRSLHVEAVRLSSMMDGTGAAPLKAPWSR